MVQLAPAASIFLVVSPASGQVLETSLNGVDDSGVPAIPSPNVATELPRLVIAIVFNPGLLAAVSIPKSSSFGAKTIPLNAPPAE